MLEEVPMDKLVRYIPIFRPVAVEVRASLIKSSDVSVEGGSTIITQTEGGDGFSMYKTLEPGARIDDK